MVSIEDLPTRRGEEKRVVVIGAGAAGLTASYQLRQAGHEVVVLEARTRPGGRVQSLRSEFADGLHAEAGAVFMPSDHEYLMRYVDLTGLSGELEPVRPEQVLGFYYLHGQRYLSYGDRPMLWSSDDSLEPTDWPGALAEEEKQLGLDELCRRYLQRIEGGLGDADSPDWPPPHLRELDDQTTLDLLRSLGATDAAVELIRVAHLSDHGDNGRNVSALFALQQWADMRLLSEFNTFNTIAGGNDRWLVRLAAMLGDRIHYGSEAVAIADTGEEVAVTVRRNGQQSVVQGDFVICALPFAVLRKIAITPDFSPPKKRVIAELQSSQISHLFIQCERRVWRRPDGRGLVALSMTDTDLAAVIRDATFNQPGSRAILDLFLAGPQAERMDALDDEERLPAVLAELEKPFPGISDVAEGAVYQSWNQDPYSLGDYVHYTPGQFCQLWPHVATPEGRIHFAGDQTSVKALWQEGAIVSAHRAAMEIAERANASE